MEGNDAGRGIPPAVESPASIKGGCYNAGTLKRLGDKGRKTREAAQNLRGNQTRDAQNKESSSEQGEVGRDSTGTGARQRASQT